LWGSENAGIADWCEQATGVVYDEELLMNGVLRYWWQGWRLCMIGILPFLIFWIDNCFQSNVLVNGMRPWWWRITMVCLSAIAIIVAPFWIRRTAEKIVREQAT
jgi:hypothetical protein